MKVLVIGNGGREHAIAWKVAQSPRADAIYAIPGNSGTAGVAENIDIPLSEITSIINKARELGIGLAIIGPEAPLSEGIADRFQSVGIPVFGPSAASARLESSKSFARSIMLANNVPCALGRTFSDYSEARSYLEKQQAPIVVKADGLAAGKGVTVAGTIEEALAALESIMHAKVFGAAGEKVVIEECLTGKEVSLLAFTDGKTVLPMVPACDYKRVFDGEMGPNTGGMGSYSPPGFFDQKMIEHVTISIIKPIVAAMANAGTPYKGVLYTGLIMTTNGPRVLEFNVRFGDPETQAILPRLQSDIVDIMMACIDGTLDKVSIRWSAEPCVGVVLTSGGYPGDFKKGYPIVIKGKMEKGLNIFYAGTRQGLYGQQVTDGGRVLTVAACGATMQEAREKVYRNIEHIDFTGKHFRTDIAAREVN